MQKFVTPRFGEQTPLNAKALLPESPESIERRRENNRKRLARQLFHKHLRWGTITRKPCEVCGTTEQIEGHHEDYSKPLDVRWLCRTHHQELHP